jgi:hypothetical protein
VVTPEELAIAHGVVNLTGPLGIGKTRLAQRIPGAVVVDLAVRGSVERLRSVPESSLVVVDSVDSDEAASVLRSARARAVIALSRRPLSVRGWSPAEFTEMRLDRWPDAVIADLATKAGCDPALVVRLAGGIPLLAELACRELHRGTPVVAAVADTLAEAVVDRLAREQPRKQWRQTLRTLAAVLTADEAVLRTRADRFTALSTLSVVSRTELGLTIDEPYRSVLDLGFRWRQPVVHREVLTRAAAYRRRQLASTTDPDRQGKLVELGLFLSDEPVLRESLYPPTPPARPVRPATPDDTEDIARLMRSWAHHGGLDQRRCDTLIDQWLGGGTDGFHLTDDTDGRPIGVVHMFGVTNRTMDMVEPLVQQHTQLAGQAGGLLLAAAYCPQPAAHALLLRYILTQVIHHGHLMVSTPSSEYQRLVRSLDFTALGQTRDDVYLCGRNPAVYSQSFATDSLPLWLHRLASRTSAGTDGVSVSVSGRLAWALERVGDVDALAMSPLLAAPHTPTPVALRGWLVAAIDDLAASAVPADAEAGTLLRRYYLRKSSTHEGVARQLHLSRATYFRRLRHGLGLLEVRFSAGV